MSEFERINQPRAERALQTLHLITKSARSLRKEGDSDHAALLQPIVNYLVGFTPLPPEAPEPAPAPAPASTETGKFFNVDLGELDKKATTDLVDLMIACGAVLERRRK